MEGKSGVLHFVYKTTTLVEGKSGALHFVYKTTTLVEGESVVLRFDTKFCRGHFLIGGTYAVSDI